MCQSQDGLSISKFRKLWYQLHLCQGCDNLSTEGGSSSTDTTQVGKHGPLGQPSQGEACSRWQLQWRGSQEERDHTSRSARRRGDEADGEAGASEHPEDQDAIVGRHAIQLATRQYADVAERKREAGTSAHKIKDELWVPSAAAMPHLVEKSIHELKETKNEDQMVAAALKKTVQVWKTQGLTWQAMQEAVSILRIQKKTKPVQKNVLIEIKDQERLGQLRPDQEDQHSIGWAMVQIRHVILQQKGHRYLPGQEPAGEMGRRLRGWVDAK